MKTERASSMKATSPFNRVNNARDREITELRDQGWTYRALAERYGLSVSGVQCVLRRESHRRNYPPVLGLSTRASDALRLGCGCFWEGAPPLVPADVAAIHYSDLIKFPNIGVGSVLEIALMLRRHGFEMKGLPRALQRQLQNAD